MTIDTSRAVEIEASPLKLLGFVLSSAVMTALMSAAAFRAVPAIEPGSFAEFSGYFGIVFFGACTLLSVWLALKSRGPVITITREGIRNSRVATDVIPWNAVKDITTWQQGRHQLIVLVVDPAVEARLNLTRVARWARKSNRALGVDGLCMGAGGLKIGFDELLATCRAFARAWQLRAAVTRGHAAADEGR